MGEGYLTVNVFAADHAFAISNVKVLIKNPNGTILYDQTSDESGVTSKVILYAPDKEASLDPYSKANRFAVYDVEVPRVKGYKRAIYHGVQIFDKETSILPIQLHPEIIGDSPEENTDEITIPPEHGVDIDRPQSDTTVSRENNINNLNDIGAMQTILANEVVIPEYITVHLGSPNAYARNVRVPFIDYIKNVASSEIFPTWDEAALYANIYSQISFALNRIHTVWYRSRGFDFEITNSTAFDQYFVDGRNIFENISRIVDGIFNNFIRRQGRREPFFAQYCNGTTVTCDGLSQWGSQDLAVRGYSSMQILKYYYPDDIQIVESTNFTTDTGTYPGAPLKEGSSGPDVLRMQNYLNRISGNFYISPISNPDGIFGSRTKATVVRFQEIDNLVPDGIIGKSTWYAITKIYVAVARLAELDSEGERISVGANPPTSVLQVGSRGEDVVELQFLINFISRFFPSIPFVIQNGVFREDTKRGVTEFQKEFKLTSDGIVGPTTWQKLYDVYYSIQSANGGNGGAPEIPPDSSYPGFSLRIGSRGEEVRLIQMYLADIAKIFPVIPVITADGVFGAATQSATTAFQRFFGLTPDGIIGRITWDKITSVRSSLPDIVAPQFPGTSLRVGSRGNDVIIMQQYLNAIAGRYPSIPAIVADGIFGSNTERAVIAFQNQFGQTPDGVIGINTWNLITSVFNLTAMNTVQTAGTGFWAVNKDNSPISKYMWLLAFSLFKR